MVKEPACRAGDAGDPGSIPGSGRSPGGGNGSPLWYFCLENPMDRGAWRATVPGVAKESNTTEHDAMSVHPKLLIYTHHVFPLLTCKFVFNICKSISVL